jgi:hypothetical protein
MPSHRIEQGVRAMVVGHSHLGDVLRELLETDGCFEVLTYSKTWGPDEVDIVILTPEIDEDPFSLIDDSFRDARVFVFGSRFPRWLQLEARHRGIKLLYSYQSWQKIGSLLLREEPP